MEQTIAITGDTIRLGQVLKLAAIAPGGAEAKAMIARGEITVNGEPELRRGRQLRAGDEVRASADVLRIVAA